MVGKLYIEEAMTVFMVMQPETAEMRGRKEPMC